MVSLKLSADWSEWAGLLFYLIAWHFEAEVDILESVWRTAADIFVWRW